MTQVCVDKKRSKKERSIHISYQNKEQKGGRAIIKVRPPIFVNVLIPKRVNFKPMKMQEIK